MSNSISNLIILLVTFRVAVFIVLRIIDHLGDIFELKAYPYKSIYSNVARCRGRSVSCNKRQIQRR